MLRLELSEQSIQVYRRYMKVLLIQGLATRCRQSNPRELIR